MAASSSLLVSLEPLRLGLRDRLLELRLASLVDTPGRSIKSPGVITERLKLLVFRTASALEADARLASALASAISSFLRRDVLWVGATTSLAGATDADRGSRQLFETRFVDAGLFRSDSGLGVERVFEATV